MTRVLETLANRLREDGDQLGKLAAQMCRIINRSQELDPERLEAVRLQLIEGICEAGYAADLKDYAIIQVAATLAHPMNCPTSKEREGLGKKLTCSINAYCDVEEAA